MVNFLAAALFGAMISFMILVSPVVFKILTPDDTKNFLRMFFPRLFNFGLILSGLLIFFSFQESNLFDQSLSIIIFFGFLINQFIITPKVNRYRDLELKGVKNAKKIFTFLHFLSVCIFVLQLILSLIIIFN
ncbi:DUF4149 domain-containing protein [Nitrosomonadales bacterium]|nr:DUF4149 domain-containing protein [Nitrosomonadales bacterium]